MSKKRKPRKKKEVRVKKQGDYYPTSKQWDLIEKMEKRLKIKFEGTSRWDASRYISEYYPEYKLYLDNNYVFGRQRRG